MSQDAIPPILLTTMQYTHIINNNSGEITLLEGPVKKILQAEESVYDGIENKILLDPNQYVVILNPFRGGSIQQGEREQRKGPQIFALHPGELLDGDVKSAFVLTKDKGIYIRNIKTGHVRLEIGPKRIFLETDEDLFHEELSQNELNALYSSNHYPPYSALRIDLQKDDVIQLYNKDQIRIVQGPKRVFLGPYERPKLFNLSGDTPKRPGVLIKSKISVSPSFITDILSIRTKDNAILKLRVRFKQRIILDQGNLSKVFLINDFIGFAVETLASEIREESAKYDFEDFHSNASEIVKNAVFRNSKPPTKNNDPSENSEAHTAVKEDSRLFENGLEIFGVDIKEIVPEDPEIIAKLNTAISKNMDVYVDKILQTAELDARRLLIEGEKGIEVVRRELIQLQTSNSRKEEIEYAKINAEASFIRSKGDADAEKIIQDAEVIAETNHTKTIRDAIGRKGGEKYLKLLEYQSIGKINKTLILNSDDKLELPLSDTKKSD